MKKLKAFTLFELVIVLLIMGIVATAATPNMIHRIRKSKADTAQSQARSIFNSAQTIVQKYETLDKAIVNDDKKFFIKNIHGDGKNTHYFGNLTNTKIDKEKNTANNKIRSEFYDKLRAMNTHLDNGNWIIIVKDYKVTHVLWSENQHNKYVGVYCGCGSHKNYESYNDNSVNNIFDVFALVDT